jgi:uncharacterized protein YceK
MKIQFFLGVMILLAGCSGAVTTTTSSMGHEPTSANPHLFSKTARVGVQAVYGASRSTGIKFPSTGIDGQQTNCITLNPHSVPLKSLQVNATWVPQSSLVEKLRFFIANGELSQVEAEQTGASPFSFNVPIDHLRPSNVADNPYAVGVQLSNETSDPKVAVSQGVDLTVTVIAGDNVDFSLASCSAAVK